MSDPHLIAHAFNSAINERDIDVLEELLTDDSVFIDSSGAEVRGRKELYEAWSDFFNEYPDYHSHFEEVHTHEDDEVVIAGHTTCSDDSLEGPALWRARVEYGKIAEWQVYEDTLKNRDELGL